MAQFVSFDPNVEVSGFVVWSYVAAMGDAARPLLAQHGLGKVERERWYPLQPLLDVFQEIADGGFDAILDLVHIGMKIPEYVLWPPEIQTLEDALFSIDQAYHMNHRGGEIGHYHTQRLGERYIRVVAENPYPCDFDYGIIYAIAKRYLPADGHLVVEHDPQAPCRKHGADSCTYHVTW